MAIYIAWVVLISLKKKRLDTLKRVSRNKDFFIFKMPFQKNALFESNQYLKSSKVSFVTYTDVQSFFSRVLV